MDDLDKQLNDALEELERPGLPVRHDLESLTPADRRAYVTLLYEENRRKMDLWLQISWLVQARAQLRGAVVVGSHTIH